MSDDPTLPLSDIAPERARRENDMIDEQFTEKENRIETLEAEVSDLESERDTLEAERDKLKEVVETYRDQRADELTASIRETIEGAAVSEDDFDFEFADLDDADIDTLETVKSAVETTVEAAGIQADDRVGNRGESPDLGDVDGGESPDTDEVEEMAMAAAKDLGMQDKWQKLQNGEDLATRTSFTAGDSANETSVDDLTSALQELVD